MYTVYSAVQRYLFPLWNVRIFNTKYSAPVFTITWRKTEGFLLDCWQCHTDIIQYPVPGLPHNVPIFSLNDKKSLLFTGTYSAHGRGNYNTVSYFNQSVIRPYVKAGYVSDIIALKITQISYSAYLQNINKTYVKNINLCLTRRFLLLVSSWFVLRFPLLPSEGEPLKQCIAAWNAQITPASNCY